MQPELEYIINKFGLDLNAKLPIEIPDFGRDGLAQLFAELGYTSGAEIGVEQGIYTDVLAKANPQAKIYGIDAWQAYSGYKDHISQEKLDHFFVDAATQIAPYRNVTLIRKFSMEAVKDFLPNSLDWVYIDANHEIPYVMNDIFYWSKCVRVGGIISGHDFKENKRLISRNHVVHAVKAYTGAFRIRPWFLLGTKAIVEGQVRDRPRSWMWVKGELYG